jgi:hypothetical protein
VAVASLAVAGCSESAQRKQFQHVEVTALEDAAITRAEGRPADGEDSAILATFTAVPIDPGQEIHMDWESAIGIGFDGDRLPDTLRFTANGSIIWTLRNIVPDIREVFRALAPFLPAEPPAW